MENNVKLLPKQAFKKGHTPWNKGKKMSSGTKKKLSEIQKELWKQGVYTLDRNEKISKTMKGRKPQNYPNWRPARASLGKKASEETRRKMSEAQKGEKSHLWKGGISKITKTERMLAMETLEYQLWREKVFKRDDYTCVECLKRGVKLHADHIIPWSKSVKLRYDIDNGRTLCVPCHRKTDTYGRKVEYATI